MDSQPPVGEHMENTSGSGDDKETDDIQNESFSIPLNIETPLENMRLSPDELNSHDGPPPLTCSNTANVYNVDISIGVFEELSEIDTPPTGDDDDEKHQLDSFPVNDDFLVLNSTDNSVKSSLHLELSDEQVISNDIYETDEDDDFGDFEEADDDFNDFSKELYPISNEDDIKVHNADFIDDDTDLDNLIKEIEFSDDDDLDFGPLTSFDKNNQDIGFEDEDDMDSFKPMESIKISTPETTLEVQENKSFSEFISLTKRWYKNICESEPNVDVKTLLEIVEDDAFIWKHLADCESTLSLSLNWNTLSSKRIFFKSINVDSRNVLYKNKLNVSVPIFAQTLSFSPLMPAPKEISNFSPIDQKIMNLLPEPITTRPSEFQECINVPPAKFDWNSSGLTNPLTQTSSIEDVILNQTTEIRHNQSPLVKKLMTESQNAEHKTTPIESLSAEVQKCISNIPDLSFMKAKVFRFPIK